MDVHNYDERLKKAIENVGWWYLISSILLRRVRVL